MTVTVANLVANTNTFGDWVTKTNVLADITTNQTVTVGGTVATGNAVIDGTMQVVDLVANTISGGEIGNTAGITVTTNAEFEEITTFTGNVVFNSANAYLGSLSKFMTSGANSTHFTVAANSSTNKLFFQRAVAVTNTGNATITGSLSVGANVTPSSNGTVDLGNTSSIFDTLFVANVNLAGTDLDSKIIRVYDSSNTQVFP